MSRATVEEEPASSDPSYVLSPVEEGDAESWRAVVDAHPHSTPFHTIAWKRAVESAFEYVPQYRLVRDADADAVVGAVPGFEMSRLVGRDVAQPFCEYGYPLLDAAAEAGSVLRSLAGTLGRFDARVVKDAPWSRVTGYRAAGYGGVRTGCTFRLGIEDGYDRVRGAAYDGEVRRNVENARESGVSVRTADVDAYYPVYRRTMRRLGSPQFPRAFLEALARSFGDDCEVLVAERDGTVAGGVLTLSTDDVTVVWSSASRADCWEYTPNHLLYDAAIARAADRGRETVDFGRTSPGTGVHRFKRQFGGREYPLVSLVAPATRVDRGSIDQYRRLEPVVERLGPLITHPRVGPGLKERIHE